MRTSGRQKNCNNCRSLMPVESFECIYCGYEAPRDGESPEAPLFTHQSLEDSLSSLYQPPYSIHNRPPKKPESTSNGPASKNEELLKQPSLFSEDEEVVEKSSEYEPPFQKANPFQSVSPTVDKERFHENPAQERSFEEDLISGFEDREETSNKPEKDQKSHQPRFFWSMLSMIIGGNLFVMGLMQLLFSEQGTLSLEWDARFWFVYLISAIPLLFFGFRKANE